MKFAVVFGSIGVGLLLLVLSGLWPMLFTGTSSWTAEKAARWAEVKDRIHNLSFVVHSPVSGHSMHSGPDRGAVKAEYDELKVEAEQLKNDFELAYNSPRTMATVLKWTGISLAGIGIIGLLAVRES